MSNDEQPAYTEAEAVTARLLPEESVEATPFRIGTVVSEGVPLQAAEPVQRLEPLERVQAAEPLQRVQAAEPLQRVQAAEPLEPLQPMEQRTARVAAEPATPLQPFERAVEGTPLQPLQPFEQAEPASAAQPLQRMSAGVPLQATTARTAASTSGGGSGAGGGGGGSGSAGQGFKVDPEQYRAAVSPMLAASEQVGELYRSLSAFLPSLEAQNPWGNDESGKKFAEGEKGYLKYSHDTLDVVKGLPEALKGIADGLKAMAESYQNADQNVVSELGGIDSTAPMPVAPSMPTAPVHLPITPRITQSGRH